MVKLRGENWDFQAFVSSEVQPVLRSPTGGGGTARGGSLCTEAGVGATDPRPDPPHSTKTKHMFGPDRPTTVSPHGTREAQQCPKSKLRGRFPFWTPAPAPSFAA